MKTPFFHQCALRLLDCYPSAWRERYAEEVTAVLEERPATFLTLCDLFLGMLDAHLHIDLFTERKFVMSQHLRNSQIVIYCFALLFFSALWPLYAGGINFWFRDLANLSHYQPIFDLIRSIGPLIMLTTQIGILVLIAIALKQALTSPGKQLVRPFIWGLAKVLCLIVLQAFFVRIVEQLYGSYAAFLLSQNLLLMLGLFALVIGDICLALAFVALKQMLVSKREKNARSFVGWLSGLLATIALLIALLQFSNLTRGPPGLLPFANPMYGLGLFVDFALIVPLAVIPLIAFGSVFVATLGVHSGLSSAYPHRLLLLPAVLVILFMSIALLITLFLTIELHIGNSDLGLARYVALNFIILTTVVFTVLCFIALWRAIKAQRSLA